MYRYILRNGVYIMFAIAYTAFMIFPFEYFDPLKHPLPKSATPLRRLFTLLGTNCGPEKVHFYLFKLLAAIFADKCEISFPFSAKMAFRIFMFSSFLLMQN
uniref:Uncharacterized protein n=1 Tax=Cacopsylla melanoneura TaxID=428564 RepID=A0A8D8W7P1_9HEMI